MHGQESAALLNQLANLTAISLLLPQRPVALVICIQQTGMDFRANTVTVFCPQIGSDLARIGIHTLLGKILTYTSHIALENAEGVAINFRRHRLGKSISVISPSQYRML